MSLGPLFLPSIYDILIRESALQSALFHTDRGLDRSVRKPVPTSSKVVDIQ